MYKIRELERKDLAIINTWRNDPEIIQFLGAPYRFINYDVDNKWFDGYMSSRNSTIRCAVVTEHSDEILCLVTLADIELKKNHYSRVIIMTKIEPEIKLHDIFDIYNKQKISYIIDETLSESDIKIRLLTR